MHAPQGAPRPAGGQSPAICITAAREKTSAPPDLTTVMLVSAAWPGLLTVEGRSGGRTARSQLTNNTQCKGLIPHNLPYIYRLLSPFLFSLACSARTTTCLPTCHSSRDTRFHPHNDTSTLLPVATEPTNETRAHRATPDLVRASHTHSPRGKKSLDSARQRQATPLAAFALLLSTPITSPRDLSPRRGDCPSW